MSDSFFKIGDVVQLHSGGPKMTVAKVFSAGGDPSVRCDWFAGSKSEGKNFHPDQLKLAPMGDDESGE